MANTQSTTGNRNSLSDHSVNVWWFGLEVMASVT